VPPTLSTKRVTATSLSTTAHLPEASLPAGQAGEKPNRGVAPYFQSRANLSSFLEPP
jgi:hypothetical protein